MKALGRDEAFLYPTAVSEGGRAGVSPPHLSLGNTHKGLNADLIARVAFAVCGA